MIETNVIVNTDCFDYMAQMPDKCVDFVLTDIPYGECSGFNEGGYRTLNRDEADKDADGSDFDYIRYTAECMRICRGNVVIFCGRKQTSGIITEMEKHDAKMIRLMIWEKPTTSPMNAHLFFVNTIEQAVGCRQTGAYFAGKHVHPVFRHNTMPLDIHPTAKPVPLLKELIELCCPPDGIVFDGCAGSCTTAVAAHQCHRKYICLEKNPEFYNKAKEYWNNELAQEVMF